MQIPSLCQPGISDEKSSAPKSSSGASDSLFQQHGFNVSQNTTLSPDWLGLVLTAIGMILSVGIVLMQLGRQHKSSLALQRDNVKEELKLRVYESLGIKAQAFSDAEMEAGSYARSIWQDLDSRVWSANVGLKRSIIKLRVDELSKLHFTASAALIDLIYSMEHWEIAFPAAKLFRVAFFSANHDVDEAFQPLHEDAIRLLPVDLGDDRLHVPALPTIEGLAELKSKVDSYLEARSTLRAYTHDLSVESQNLLLSNLFKNRVEIRRPFDPSYKVITASNTEALMCHFMTESDSGRAWQAGIDRAREAASAKCVKPED